MRVRVKRLEKTSETAVRLVRADILYFKVSEVLVNLALKLLIVIGKTRGEKTSFISSKQSRLKRVRQLPKRCSDPLRDVVPGHAVGHRGLGAVLVLQGRGPHGDALLAGVLQDEAVVGEEGDGEDEVGAVGPAELAVTVHVLADGGGVLLGQALKTGERHPS